MRTIEMKAYIKTSKSIALRDLPVGIYAEGTAREDAKRRAIYVKIELRDAAGNVLSTHVFDLMNPHDQYPDKIDLIQTVNVLGPGDIIELHL